jgi:hypothetical protein
LLRFTEDFKQWLKKEGNFHPSPVNCGIGSKTESISWVEAKNEAPSIRRWGDERVVVIFT